MNNERSPYDSSVILQEEALDTLIQQIKNYIVGGKGTGILLVPSENHKHLQVQNAYEFSPLKGGFSITDKSNNNTSTYFTIAPNISFLNTIDTFVPGTFSVEISEVDSSGQKPAEIKYVNIKGFDEQGNLNIPNNTITAKKVIGAVYNDYAEYRKSDALKAGCCVIETGKGDLIKSTERLQLGANIVSDTFGFSIGETETAKTPIAVCGRVLAYPSENITLYTPGAAVCSGPDGKISLMTREEIKEWPDAIVGYVSEIPNYETWGSENINVDGRIWIKIK